MFVNSLAPEFKELRSTLRNIVNICRLFVKLLSLGHQVIYEIEIKDVFEVEFYR